MRRWVRRGAARGGDDRGETRRRRRRRAGTEPSLVDGRVSDGDGGGGGDRGGGTRVGYEPRGDPVRTRQGRRGARPRDETDGSETDGSETDGTETESGRRLGAFRSAGSPRDYAFFAGERRARVPRSRVRAPARDFRGRSTRDARRARHHRSSRVVDRVVDERNRDVFVDVFLDLDRARGPSNGGGFGGGARGGGGRPMVVKPPDVAGRSRFRGKIAARSARVASTVRPAPRARRRREERAPPRCGAGSGYEPARVSRRNRAFERRTSNVESRRNPPRGRRSRTTTRPATDSPTSSRRSTPSWTRSAPRRRLASALRASPMSNGPPADFSPSAWTPCSAARRRTNPESRMTDRLLRATLTPTRPRRARGRRNVARRVSPPSRAWLIFLSKTRSWTRARATRSSRSSATRPSRPSSTPHSSPPCTAPRAREPRRR